MHLIHHLAALGAAVWLLWLPGWWIERRFPVAQPMRVVARFLAGTAFWVAILFTLAALGLYRPAAIWTLIILVHLLAGIDRVRSFRHARLKPLFLLPSFGTPFSLLSVLTAILLLTPILLLAMTPAISWDADVYHLTLPKLYLEAGGFQTIPMSVYSHWPHGLEMVFGAAMALDSYILAKLLHFFYGILVIVTLTRLVPGLGGWFAAALFISNPVVLFEMRVAYIDLAHAFTLLAGVAFAIQARGSDDLQDGALEDGALEDGALEDGTEKDGQETRGSALFMAGLAAGLLVSLKVTGLISAGCIAVLLMPSWLKGLRLTGPRGIARSVSTFAVPCLALGAPWWIKTWILTGNPLYPWLYGLFGGPDWSPALGEQLNAWQKSIGMGREWADYLLLPWRVIVSGGQGYERFDGEIALFWLVAIPLSLLALRSTTPSTNLWRGLVFVAVLHAAFWAATSQQMRFLIPVLALLAAPAAAAAAHLTKPWSSMKASRRRLIATFVTLSVLAFWLVEYDDILASGSRLLPSFLHPTSSPRAEVAPVFGEIEKLPPDARLLFLNTNLGFHSSRPYLADSFFEASQINDWLKDAPTPLEVRQRLEDRSITHVLYVHLPNGGLPYPQPLFGLLNDASAVERLFFDGRHMLLALK